MRLEKIQLNNTFGETGTKKWSLDASTVQDYWNMLETKLVKIIDVIVPYGENWLLQYYRERAGPECRRRAPK